jgi:hypothetical protein
MLPGALYALCILACAQSLSRLTGLNALNLSFNPLPALPPVIAALTALLELNLDYTGGLGLLHCTALHWQQSALAAYMLVCVRSTSCSPC